MPNKRTSFTPASTKRDACELNVSSCTNSCTSHENITDFCKCAIMLQKELLVSGIVEKQQQPQQQEMNKSDEVKITALSSSSLSEEKIIGRVAERCESVSTLYNFARDAIEEWQSKVFNKKFANNVNKDMINKNTSQSEKQIFSNRAKPNGEYRNQNLEVWYNKHANCIQSCLNMMLMCERHPITRECLFVPELQSNNYKVKLETMYQVLYSDGEKLLKILELAEMTKLESTSAKNFIFTIATHAHLSFYCDDCCNNEQWIKVKSSNKRRREEQLEKKWQEYKEEIEESHCHSEQYIYYCRTSNCEYYNILLRGIIREELLHFHTLFYQLYTVVYDLQEERDVHEYCNVNLQENVKSLGSDKVVNELPWCFTETCINHGFHNEFYNKYISFISQCKPALVYNVNSSCSMEAKEDKSSFLYCGDDIFEKHCNRTTSECKIIKWIYQCTQCMCGDIAVQSFAAELLHELLLESVSLEQNVNESQRRWENEQYLPDQIASYCSTNESCCNSERHTLSALLRREHTKEVWALPLVHHWYTNGNGNNNNNNIIINRYNKDAQLRQLMERFNKLRRVGDNKTFLERCSIDKLVNKNKFSLFSSSFSSSSAATATNQVI